jgi:hypothetical protein
VVVAPSSAANLAIQCVDMTDQRSRMGAERFGKQAVGIGSKPFERADRPL